jgi:hypothetical protein
MRRPRVSGSRLRAACSVLRSSCCALLELASLAALFRSTQRAARSTHGVPYVHPIGG